MTCCEPCRRKPGVLHSRRAARVLAATLAALLASALGSPSLALAGSELTVLPRRDAVQVTIYNELDVTLVREHRTLTLHRGINHLQLSAANTMEDPTSFDLRPLAHAEAIRVIALSYPPHTNDLGQWTIESEVEGAIPFEVFYLMSGLSWRAVYVGTLATDETTMRLDAYVMVTNNGGERFENAQTRLVVGVPRLYEPLSELSLRWHPFNAPWGISKTLASYNRREAMLADRFAEVEWKWVDDIPPDGTPESGSEFRRKMRSKKTIVKEGLSEYMLYTIEGHVTLASAWTKRLPSFYATDIPVANLYKYDEARYGAGQVVRFLSYRNDTAHKLGDTPIPGGSVQIYRQIDAARHLNLVGTSNFKYIPIDEDVELNLGAVENVMIEPTLMRNLSAAFTFDRRRNLAGWDGVQEWQIIVRNTRDMAVQVQVTRDLQHADWLLAYGGDFGTYEKIDLDTIRFTLDVPPRSTQTFSYTVTYHEGTNRQ